MSSPTTGNHPAARSIAWTITRRMGMVIALALAFFLSATITIYTLFRIGDTRVPDIIGKPEAEAQKLAEKAGLKVKVTRRNDAAPADTVIETRPGPNASVKKDSTLSIVVSAGPAKSQWPVFSLQVLVCRSDWAGSSLPTPFTASGGPKTKN